MGANISAPRGPQSSRATHRHAARAVSYTHLDVYKRQTMERSASEAELSITPLTVKATSEAVRGSPFEKTASSRMVKVHTRPVSYTHLKKTPGSKTRG